ncbi:MAG: putative phage-associated protein [Acidimicrobiales bacterium]|jgi:uncharacterized phage-associated protein
MSDFTPTKSQTLLCEIISRLDGEVKDKTQLAKLEYFSDFIHYAFHDKPISEEGNIYQRRKQGPLSRAFNDDLNTLCENNFLKNKAQYTYSTTDKKCGSLSDEELTTVNFVISKYGKTSYRELVKIAHSQIPYLSASGDGAVIEYSTAYNLVDEYPDYATLQVA